MKFIIWLPRAMCRYPLMRRNIPVMWMHWVSCVWKRRVCGLTKTCKVYQASTLRTGKVEEVLEETTPFHPYSPYAVAKQYGFWMVKEYRDAYGMFAVNGILFNHESERRGENFVTRKITLAAGRIAEGLQDHLELGNMDSLRDWGYARDYVECMWLIMQQENPEDFLSLRQVYLLS